MTIGLARFLSFAFHCADVSRSRIPEHNFTEGFIDAPHIAMHEGSSNTYEDREHVHDAKPNALFQVSDVSVQKHYTFEL